MCLLLTEGYQHQGRGVSLPLQLHGDQSSSVFQPAVMQAPPSVIERAHTAEPSAMGSSAPAGAASRLLVAEGVLFPRLLYASNHHACSASLPQCCCLITTSQVRMGAAGSLAGGLN